MPRPTPSRYKAVASLISKLPPRACQGVNRFQAMFKVRAVCSESGQGAYMPA